MMTNSPITLIKQNHRGEKVVEYHGEVLARGAAWVCVRAPFNHDDKNVGYVVFRRGDLFIEWHYSDRWYNVFELHDVDDGHLKGWYCNVTRPAIITADTIRADDLALDVFIAPDGTLTLLDGDEFDALKLSPDEQTAARDAVELIKQAVSDRQPPFQAVGGRRFALS